MQIKLIIWLTIFVLLIEFLFLKMCFNLLDVFKVLHGVLPLHVEKKNACWYTAVSSRVLVYDQYEEKEKNNICSHG
jgi:hypothetical protein